VKREPTTEGALGWVDSGWQVIELRPGRKDPATAHGLLDATTDPAQIERWHPHANIGGVTAGKVVVDADLYKPGAPEALAELEAEYGPLPETRTHRTGRGGNHRIYLQRGTPIRNRTGLATGVDIRADGGYIVLPPSALADGGPHGDGLYTVEHDVDPVPIPEAWERLLLGSRTTGTREASVSLADLRAGPVAEGGRNDRLTRLAGHLARGHTDYARYRAELGEDNARLCNPPLDEVEVHRIARSIWGLERSKPDAASKATQSDVLVRLGLDRYRLVQSDEGDTYAIPNDRPRYARPLRGVRSMRAELRAVFHETQGKTPSGSALADAMETLEGYALRQPRQTVGVRVARAGHEIVIDLADEDGSVVVVRPGSWSVTTDSPALFRRSEVNSPMRKPRGGGDVSALRRLLNVSDADWDLLVAWAVAALVPDLPHPVLWLAGEQGTGKTTAMRMLAGLVDPSPAGARTPPRDVQEWVVTASASHVLPLDNVSGLKPWLSDAICRAVTGDALVRRKLYADSDVVVNRYRRVVIVNGIDAGELRGDLGDRLVWVELDRISGAGRLPDRELEAEYERLRPEVTGALLDILAEALVALPEIDLPELPRMADFAEYVAAVDRVRGTDALATYLASRDSISSQVVESDPVALAVIRLVEVRRARKEAPFEGTAEQLLAELEQPDGVPRQAWPWTPRMLGGRLKRVAPALARTGVEIKQWRSGSTRKIRIVSTDTAPQGELPI